MSELSYKYNFKFTDGVEKNFEIIIDENNYSLKSNWNTDYPDWTEMKNFRCAHCTLGAEVKYCPLALTLVKPLKEFCHSFSFEKVEVTVETNYRDYHVHTSLQIGVSSMLGILMVTSGCPVMRNLKSLVKFHLPFASLEETQVRVFSLYLLSQYVKWRQGESPDWEMKNLYKIYDDIRLLNFNVAKKIAAIETKDTNINSLVILNNFAEYATLTLDEKTLEELENLLSFFNQKQ